MNPLILMRLFKVKAKVMKKNEIKSKVKHTFGRKLKTWVNRYRNRQLHLGALPKADETEHTCRHCGYTYKGRLCPQCGMPAEWKRFTPKQLMNSFLDIWGMGNRPMFRSMGHLLWRPGYMIRDYLSGHFLSYFPPFKMLAILIVLTAFLVWIVGVDTTTPVTGISLLKKMEAKMTGSSLMIMKGLENVMLTLANNHLYRVLTENLIIVFAAWFVFHKREINLDKTTKRTLNLVETFYSQIYINCQFQLLTLAMILFRCNIPAIDLFPYAVPDWLALIVLGYDFQQLYQLKVWGAVWRTLLFFIVTIAIYILLFILMILFAVILMLASNGWSLEIY